MMRNKWNHAIVLPQVLTGRFLPRPRQSECNWAWRTQDPWECLMWWCPEHILQPTVRHSERPDSALPLRLWELMLNAAKKGNVSYPAPDRETLKIKILIWDQSQKITSVSFTLGIKRGQGPCFTSGRCSLRTYFRKADKNGKCPQCWLLCTYTLHPKHQV